MPLKASDALVQELLAPHLTSDDGEVSCVYGMHEPYDDWIMYLFFGGLLRILLRKHLLIAVTQRRLLLMEISGFYRMKNCQSIEFDEVEQVQLREPRVFLGSPFSIVRLKVRNGNKYRITIGPTHAGVSTHEEHYRKVISFFKSLTGPGDGGVSPAAQLATRPCPNCAKRVKLEAKECRACGFRFSDQEIAAARSLAQTRASLVTDQARRQKLDKARKRSSMVAWVLIVIGGLLVFLMVLGALVAGPEAKPESKFQLGPFLGGLACLLIAFMAPGLYLLSRARRLKRDLAEPPTSPAPREPEANKIRFRCSHCDKRVSVGKQLAGKRGKCPGCGTVIQIPVAEHRK